MRRVDTNHSHRLRWIRRFPSKRISPANGASAGNSINANCVSDGRRSEAAPAGTLTVSPKSTDAVLLGVIVVGENVHVAPGGNVLCTHESVIGCCGFPVFSFSERE